MKKEGTVDPIFGIPEVDALLSGQLPRGWLGILSGVSGSGIELLAKQFAGAANPRTPVYYYTTSERTEDIKTAMRDFGWRDDVNFINISDDYYDKVLSKSLEVSRFREKGITPEEIVQFRMESLEAPPVNFITRMTCDLAAFDKAFRLVIDSLDFFLELGDPGAVLSLVRQIRYRAQRFGAVALLTLHPLIHDARTMGTLEEVADLLIDMEVQKEHQTFQHLLSLRKVRNHPERTGRIEVTINDKGISSV